MRFLLLAVLVSWSLQKVMFPLNNVTQQLRAVVSNFRESGDRAENSNFFLFAQKNPFGKLFSKIILKSSSEFLFWQKNGKFEIGLNGPSDPM